MNRGRCRSCKAPVEWIRMRSGKPNPLNPDPDPAKGNVLIVDTETDADLYACRIGRGVQLGHGETLVEREKGTELYLSHFATCPTRRLHQEGGELR